MDKSFYFYYNGERIDWTIKRTDSDCFVRCNHQKFVEIFKGTGFYSEEGRDILYMISKEAEKYPYDNFLENFSKSYIDQIGEQRD